MQTVYMGSDPGHTGREAGKWDSKEEAVFEEPIQDFSVVDVVGAIEKTGESHSYVLLVVPPFS